MCMYIHVDKIRVVMARLLDGERNNSAGVLEQGQGKKRDVTHH